MFKSSHREVPEEYKKNYFKEVGKNYGVEERGVSSANA